MDEKYEEYEECEEYEKYEEYEECEECGIQDETVEDREEIGDLGRYLCDACYANEKALMRSE